MSPKKKQFENEILALDKEITRINQPISHHYQIIPKNEDKL